MDSKSVAVAGLLLAVSACATTPRSPVEERPAVDSIVEGERVRQSIPGLSVVITRGGQVLHARGYGIADRESGTRATPQTVYQIGSISKQFTAAGILRLTERGLLSLQDRVIDVLPDLSDGWSAVRLSHLLHHTSGVPEFLFLPEFGALNADLDRPAGELQALIARQPLQFPPGGQWSYSNSNYTLLAAVIERISGMPYERFLEQEFFQPLGLASIHHCTPHPTAAHHARGYGLRDGSVVATPPENMNTARGDGGLCASAEDLARWGWALATGKAVDARSYELMTTPDPLRDGTIPAYGCGLSLVDLDGRRKVAHHGAMTGFTGMLAIYPDDDLIIAVLANRGGLWADGIEKAITREMLGLPRPDLRERPLSPGESRRYEGTYDVGAFTVRIVERDGRLWMETPPPAPTAPLLHLEEGTFVAATEPDAIRLVFAGKKLTLSMAGMHWYGSQIDRTD